MNQEFEFSILDWIQENLRSPFMDWLVPKITLLGNAGVIWIIIAVLLLLWRKHRECGSSLSLGLIMSLLIGNVFLKNVIARPRPCWIDESVDLLIANPTDYSFPSGHTLSSFIAATILFSYNKAWGIAAYMLASMIALSRLYLYVHFPSDILAGVVLGIAIGLLVVKISRNNRFWFGTKKIDNCP